MKQQGCIRTGTFLFLILILIVSMTPGHVAQAAPLAAVQNVANAFDCAAVSEIPVAECQALVALFNNTNGTGWTNSTGWLATNTPCSWFGLTCAGGHVTVVTLYANLLKGTIPAEIGNLSALTSLSLPHGQLSGPLPPELGKLTNLQSLYVAANLLSGPIPAEIGNLTNLKSLIVWGNQLSGPLPPEMGNLVNLSGALLNSNQLSGALPLQLGNLANLQTLNLSSNQFCGNIPAGMGTITKLTDLRLSGNHFYIPAEPLISQLYAKTAQDRSWTTSQTPGDCDNGSTLLALYVLAFDNDPLSATNLSGYFTATMASIAGATTGRAGVRAVVLADQSGPDNVTVYEISNGIVTQVTDNLPALSESSVVNGPELGGFLTWARATYPAQRTILNYLGHNKPLPQSGLAALPSAGLSAALQTTTLFPLPIRDGAHADFTDNTPQPATLSVYDFSEALRLASQDGAQPFDVVDISSCFSMSFEEMYALRHATLTAVGSPNYAFFEPALAGYSLKAINAGMTAAQMAAALVSVKDAVLPSEGHPRILVALDMSKLDALKQAWDLVSFDLWQGLNDTQLRQSYKDKLAQAYNYSHKYDCTFCQPQDWALETPDALVDLGSFAKMLTYGFGNLSPIGVAAGDASSILTQAIIARATRNGVPWFGNPAKNWDFTGNAGLSLYADLVGQSDGNGHIILSDIAAWYNRVESSSNPHPYEFVQSSTYGQEIQASGINWSDVFTAYWQGATNLLTRLCLPTFPPISESGDLIAGTVVSPNAGTARLGSPVTLSATVTSTTEVHNVQVSVLVYQNSHQVFSELVNVPIILAGAQIAVQTSQPWTPTETGAYTLRYFFDSNNHIQETNEKNNLVYYNGTVSGTATCPRPEIKVGTLLQQQWWTANTIQLTLEQLSQTAPSDAAKVNRLVIDFYQFKAGENPYSQVPVKVDQRTLTNISLPLGSLALPLTTTIQPGPVVLHIWPSSECGGMGLPQEITVNYLPNNATLGQNQAQYFTFDVLAGQKVDLTMHVTSGSTRMYVWLPGNSWSAQSINDDGTLTIDPTMAGRYVVSVVGEAVNTVYTLTGVLTDKSQLHLLSTTTPVVTVIRQRPDFIEPLFDIPGEKQIFLPALRR
jgi:hypothetical protein